MFYMEILTRFIFWGGKGTESSVKVTLTYILVSFDGIFSYDLQCKVVVIVLHLPVDELLMTCLHVKLFSATV